jgi:hypothetical protein
MLAFYNHIDFSTIINDFDGNPNSNWVRLLANFFGFHDKKNGNQLRAYSAVTEVIQNNKNTFFKMYKKILIIYKNAYANK